MSLPIIHTHNGDGTFQNYEPSWHLWFRTTLLGAVVVFGGAEGFYKVHRRTCRYWR